MDVGKLDLWYANSEHAIISHGPSCHLFHISKVGNYVHVVTPNGRPRFDDTLFRLQSHCLTTYPPFLAMPEASPSYTPAKFFAADMMGNSPYEPV